VQVPGLYGMTFRAVPDPSDVPDHRDSTVFHPEAEQLHAIACGSIAPDVASEMEKVRRADLLIFQFPIWWTAMPTVMKGWFEWVFVQGFVVNVGERGGIQLRPPPGQEGPRGRDGRLPAELYAPGGPHGDLHEHLCPLIRAALEFCGLELLPTHVVCNASGIAPDDADREVELYRDRLSAVESVSLMSRECIRYEP
jgi:NAD(P)H dehydrogenase (quinone)